MFTSELTEGQAEELIEHQVVYIEEVNFSGIIVVCNGKKYVLEVDWKTEGFN